MLSSFPLRMALAIGWVFHRTSRARCRLAPRSTSGSSRWLTTVRRLMASWARTVDWASCGNRSANRERPLGVPRVQGGEHLVPGLGGAEGHLGRLPVTHLADEDHVRVLP